MHGFPLTAKLTPPAVVQLLTFGLVGTALISMVNVHLMLMR